jgi:uncharacterized cupredoxin-like copper-binding protein
VSAAALRRAGVLLLALLSAALVLALRAEQAAARHAHAGSYVQVTEVEYRIMLSEAVVKAGPVHLQQIDLGMDPHDLALRHDDSPAVTMEELLSPGSMHNAIVYLKPGVYHLWCTLPGHWKLGMHAVLRVVS